MRNDLWHTVKPKLHGYLDYMAVALLLVAPSVFGWTGAPRTASYVLAALQFGLSVMTAYPLGAVRIIPFTVHATVEFATAVLMIVLPWMANFAAVDSARNFYVVCGAGLLGLWAVTDYRAAERGRRATVPGRITRRAEDLVGR